jgi:hypothetical protein
LEGFVEVPSLGGCVEKVECDEQACDALNRDCWSDGRPGCGACQEGFVDEIGTQTCRKLATCEDLNCGELACVPSTDRHDAYCAEPCPEGQVRTNTGCIDCALKCDGLGEDGVWPRATQEGKCICRTEPGYFFTFGLAVGAYPCDADGDGWVRESARESLESTDLEIRENARCDLSRISAIKLVNEYSESRTIKLPAELSLYESDRNDDDGILDMVFSDATRNLPKYGVSGKTLPMAAELNRFTKLCHARTTDYNDNGLADIEEHAQSAAVEGLLRSDQLGFNQYAYYAELYTGRLEEDAWVITERKRADAPAASLSSEEAIGPRFGTISQAEELSDGWKTCQVNSDPNAIDPATGLLFNKPGFDFALSAAPGFRGMNHHSLFKCVLIDAAGLPPQSYSRTKDNAGDGYPTPDDALFSSCRRAETEGGSPAGTLSGVIPLACEQPQVTQLDEGWAYWTIVPYRHYPSIPNDQECTEAGGTQEGPSAFRNSPIFTGYQGGCVNEALFEKEKCDLAGGCPDQCPNYEPGNASGFTYVLKTPPCAGMGFTWGHMKRCGGTEACDGLDNDGNGSVDEGSYDAPCTVTATDADFYGLSTQLRNGECLKGRVVCEGTNGLKCKPQYLQAQQERCDGLDNDCDGTIDNHLVDTPAIVQNLDKEQRYTWQNSKWVRGNVESVPELTGANCWVNGAAPSGWSAGRKKSWCSVGQWTCVGSGTTKSWSCKQLRSSTAPSSCAYMDTDMNCNGTADYLDVWNNEGGLADRMSNLIQFWRDADGDSQGDKTPASGKTATSPDLERMRKSCRSSESGWVTNSRDCCDEDNRVKDGNTSYYTGRNSCQKYNLWYDFNCDGREDKHWTATTSAECSAGITGCGEGSAGWKNTSGVPSCGSPETIWYKAPCRDAISGPFVRCERDYTYRTQECR